MGEPETLSAGREPDREPSRGVSRAAVAGACLVVAVVALAAGRWLTERQASEQASRQVAVQFVLQTVQLDQPDNRALSQTSWVAAVTGVLVNSGPDPIVVQRLMWGGALAGGPYSLRRQEASPSLTVSTVTDCRPGEHTRVPVPAASIRVVTASNLVSDQPPVIPDVDVWDTAVAQSCLSAPVSVPADFLAGGPVRYVPSGSALTVVVDIRNTGSVAAFSNPGLEAEGFNAVPVPYSLTIGPGQVVQAALHVTVADCRLARSGGINGITIAPGNGMGDDSDLTRQLDRLATRTCARR